MEMVAKTEHVLRIALCDSIVFRQSRIQLGHFSDGEDDGQKLKERSNQQVGHGHQRDVEPNVDTCGTHKDHTEVDPNQYCLSNEPLCKMRLRGGKAVPKAMHEFISLLSNHLYTP